jgi:kynurenine 3-monooxygenase
MPEKIAIAGAGLVGSLLGVYLAKKNFDVEIFERRPDARKTFLGGGRSINLALSDRGLAALERVGLADKVKREMSIPMYRRVMHNKAGELTYQPYGKNGQAINSVSRSGLNALLMAEAEKAGVKINFEETCQKVDFDKPALHFKNALSGKTHEVKADRIFGADGAFSSVRGALQKTDRFSFSQEYIEHGYKELTIPPGEAGSFLIEKEALHIWPRGNYMLIALPNPDGSFTCTLFFPYEGEPSFSSLDTTAKARAFFEEQFADALELMPHFDQEWEENPNSSLVIIRCYPWTKNAKVALLGDASHAIVPFYGQGMNSGFEDCLVFDDLQTKHGLNWEALFEEFQQLRKPDGDAIADLAMRNFEEMRDLTGDPEFLLQKKIEARFATKYPERWTPLYSLVTFSAKTRYSEALALGKKQDAVMAQIMALPNIHETWDSQAVEHKILDLVPEGGFKV